MTSQLRLSISWKPSILKICGNALRWALPNLQTIFWGLSRGSIFRIFSQTSPAIYFYFISDHKVLFIADDIRANFMCLPQSSATTWLVKGEKVPQRTNDITRTDLGAALCASNGKWMLGDTVVEQGRTLWQSPSRNEKKSIHRGKGNCRAFFKLHLSELMKKRWLLISGSP